MLYDNLRSRPQGLLFVHLVTDLNTTNVRPDANWLHAQFKVFLEDQYPVRRRRLFFVGMLRSLKSGDQSVPAPMRFVPRQIPLVNFLDANLPNLNSIDDMSTAKRRANVSALLETVGSYKRELEFNGADTRDVIAVLDIDRAPGRVFDMVILYNQVCFLNLASGPFYY